MGLFSSATASLPRAKHRRFTPRPEERLSLRFIVLVMGWWVAFSLSSVGAPLWIWIGGAALITAGHAYSWRYRSSGSTLRTAIIGAGVLGALALVPRTVSAVSIGDWLPAAYFLLLFQGIACFELRTRAGLYASIALSGVILFAVSQRSLDITFGVFLTGYTSILLSFLAMSFLADQTRNAEVRWFRSRFSFAWFWSAVFGVSMAVSLLVFLLLPKQLGGPFDGVRGAVLPLRSSGATDGPGESVDFAALASALPLTSSELNQKPDADAGRSDLDGAQRGTTGASPGTLQGNQATFPATRLFNGDEPADDGVGDDPRDLVVMRVRSPVLTYWRGQVFDTFDGEVWHPDPGLWSSRSRGSASAEYTAPRPPGNGRGPLYPQTFFVTEAAPRDTLFSGYTPLFASVPFGRDGSPHIGQGTVYRVISSFPDFSSETLEEADPSTRLGDRYHQVPGHREELRTIARELTAIAYTDLARTRRIINYLDRNYTFDVDAANQLALTSPPLEFLASRSSGTSMDFATATVLLARAAGIPARLATGYIPGGFDPLSGTYVVRDSDRHAWAEVYFNGTGWVPFDSAPSPATAAFGEGGTYRSRLARSLFGVSYASEIYDSVNSSPQSVSRFLARLFGNGAPGFVGAVGGATLLLLTAILAWRFLHARFGSRSRPDYARLMGDGRRELLRTYLDAEKLLVRVGLAPRSSSQTLTEHTGQAESWLGSARGDLAWLRHAAWAAAYDPLPYDTAMTAQARWRLDRLRAAVKALRRGQRHSQKPAGPTVSPRRAP